MRLYALILLLLVTSCQVQKDTSVRLPIEEEVVIVHATNTHSIDPTQKTASANTRSRHIFESLVGLDESLKIVPKLAVSWGNLDDLTWEFHLRPNVVFHDGSAFDAEDVLFSFDRASKFKDSQVAGSLSQIEDIELVDPLKIRIITKAPDPTLMTKLVFVGIVPSGSVSNLTEDIISTTFVGTGPYKVREWIPLGDLSLEAFPDYWGGEPLAKSVRIKSVSSKDKRVELLKSGEISILADVPPDAVEELERSGDYELVQQSGLDLHFLIFNTDLISDRNLRKALAHSVNKQELASLAPGLTRPAREMLSTSIFGYNPRIEMTDFNLDLARDVLSEANYSSDLVYTIDLEKQNRVIGEALQTYFRGLDLITSPEYLEGPQLIEKIFSGESQMYVLGWQFESPDGGDFLLNFFHTREGDLGQYNGSGYSNKAVDSALILASKTLKAKDRLKMIQNVVKTLHDDYVAIPLYETDRLYAVSNAYQFQPRIDGMVFGHALSKKPLEQ